VVSHNNDNPTWNVHLTCPLAATTHWVWIKSIASEPHNVLITGTLLLLVAASTTTVLSMGNLRACCMP